MKSRLSIAIVLAVWALSVAFNFAEPRKPKAPEFIAQSTLVKERRSYPKVGYEDFEVTVIKSTGTQSAANPIRMGTLKQRKEWFAYAVKAGSAGFTESWAYGDINACGMISLDTVAWIEQPKSHQSIVALRYSCPVKADTGPAVFNAVAVMETTAHGDPSRVIYSDHGVDYDHTDDDERILQLAYVTNLDEDADWELVITDIRYAGAAQTILSRRGDGNYSTSEITIDGWD